MTSECTDFYVYVLFRENGEPFYVGKGRGRRIKDHEQEAARGFQTHRAKLIRRILRSRPDVPKVKIREGLASSEAYDIERALIAAIGRVPFGPLINQTDGGEGVSGHSAEARARIGAAATAFHTGRKVSEETKARLRAAHLGKTRPEEARRNMSLAQKARQERERALRPPPEPKKPRGGWKLSEETKRKIAAGNLGKKMSDETRIKMSVAAKNRSPETRARMGAARKGHKHTPEAIANMKAAWCLRREQERARRAL